MWLPCCLAKAGPWPFGDNVMGPAPRLPLSNAQRGLIVAGAALFLLGLLQGAAVPAFANPRMALSAHLTAVQSGMALMVVGLVWPALSLRPALAAFARWGVIIGIYGLWIGLTLAAAAGASQGLPIAGNGHHAGAETERIVTAIIIISSALMTLGWVLFLIGLISPRR